MSVGMAISKHWQQIASFFHRQGTAILTTVCVGIVTAAALWYPQVRESQPLPAPADEQAAARLLQQTLPPVTQSPAASPIPFIPPLSDPQVLQPFDTDTMVQDPLTGIWRVHAAVLFAGQPGEPVRAIADGTVQSCTLDGQGTWHIVLALQDGITAEYAGLTQTSLSPGDAVRTGQIIGQLRAEANPPPHLYLCLIRNGRPIDPLPLLSGC